MTSLNNKIRCFGNKPNQELYAQYHDTEWGRPTHDDQQLFEMLILESAQAGLSWETILKRRNGYREAFHNFDPKKVAAMSDDKLESLRSNTAIIRNRLKINAARKNARVFLKIQDEFGSFDAYIWKFVNHAPIMNNRTNISDTPSETPISQAISKNLKKRGMTFVGPTIIYAYMQSIGMVDDHAADCWLKTKK